MSWAKKLIKLFLGFKNSVTIVMLGLDKAGKTTILNYLRSGDPGVTIPTMGANYERFSVRNLELKVWDLGGQKAFRKMWVEYAERADAIIFVIDAADRSRFLEAKQEFWKVVSMVRRKVPVLILANKADLENAATPGEIIDFLEPYKLGDRPWQVVWTSGLTGFGLYEAFGWLYEKLTGERILTPVKIEDIIIIDDKGRPLIRSPANSRSVTLSAFLSLAKDFVKESMEDIPTSIEMQDKKIVIVSNTGLLAAAVIPRRAPESQVRALLSDVLNRLVRSKSYDRAKEILTDTISKYMVSYY